MDNRIFLKDGWPTGTTVTSKFIGGGCLETADDTSFTTTTSPFSDCSYRSSNATFDYAVTLPDGRVSVSRVQYVKSPLAALSFNCVWSLPECGPWYADPDRVQVRLSYPEQFSRTLQRNDFLYCAAEGYRCNGVPYRQSLAFIYLSIRDPAKAVAKEIVYSGGNPAYFDGDCRASSFGNKDPDPGFAKYCVLAPND